MGSWIDEAIVYHIYTLGFCGAFEENKGHTANIPIREVLKWIPHLKSLGVNTILFGPLFKSTEHGYDIVDYYQIDPRVGSNEDFKEVCQELHKNGFRIVLDGVFNHVGRDFKPFKDLQQKGQASQYKEWFCNVQFGQSTPYGDAFSYEAWEGHYNLVKLNVWHGEVRDYLFNAVKMWIEEFGIDGLRLDVAYCIDEGFLGALRNFTDTQKSDFWLMGEMIHGDYTRLTKPGLLHATTNYECYKGIYSSHNDKNYFEINHSLNRLFGKGGLYAGLKLYNFVDNHDVERIATILKQKQHLYNVYTLLYTMPGVPSIYYGSEWGIEGKKNQQSDDSLRPALDIEEMLNRDQSLAEHLKKLAKIRQNYPELCGSGYEQIVVKNEQLIFARGSENNKLYVLLNLAECEVELGFNAPYTMHLKDVLNEGVIINSSNGQYNVKVPAYAARVLAQDE